MRYEKIIPSLPPPTETTRPYPGPRQTSRTEHAVNALTGGNSSHLITGHNGGSARVLPNRPYHSAWPARDNRARTAGQLHPPAPRRAGTAPAGSTATFPGMAACRRSPDPLDDPGLTSVPGPDHPGPVGVPAIRKPVLQARRHEQQTECQRHGDPGRPCRRQMRMLTQRTQPSCRRQHVVMIFGQRRQAAAARRHPDSLADSRLTRQLFAYEMLAERRNQQDSMLWQAPALALTAQAFLLTIALGGNAVSVFARALTIFNSGGYRRV